MYNIEIKKQSRFKQFCSRIRYKIEEVFLSLLLKIPEKLIPQVLMQWVGSYLKKRNQELRIQATQINYNNAYLGKAVDELKNK